MEITAITSCAEDCGIQHQLSPMNWDGGSQTLGQFGSPCGFGVHFSLSIG